MNTGLLNQSFYKEKAKDGKFYSVKFIEKYLINHKIDILLRKCFDSIIQPNLLPRNPYFGLYRGLSLEILNENVKSYFSQRNNKINVNRITSQSIYSASIELESLKIYSSAALLENVNKKSANEALKNFLYQYSLNEKIIICYSGPELLRSSYLEYPQSHSYPFEIVNYCIYENKMEISLSKFSKFIYEQCMDIMQGQSKKIDNLFMELRIIEPNQATPDYVWKKSQILLFKTKLLNDIEKCAPLYKQITVQSVEEINNQYRIVTRRYIFVLKQLKNGSTTEFEYKSYQSYPLSALFHGVFTSKEDLQLYIKFYVADQKSTAQIKDIYNRSQGRKVIKHLYNQSIVDMGWELFYLSIMQENKTMQDIVNQAIFQLIAGDLAEVESIIYTLNILNIRLQNRLYILLDEIQIILERTFAKLKGIFEKGRNPDMTRNKELILKLSKYIIQNAKLESRYLKVSTAIGKIVSCLKLTVLNSYQKNLCLNKEVVILLNKINDQTNFKKGFKAPNYNQIILNKVEPDYVNISEQAIRIKKEFSLSSEKQASDLVYVQYLKQYNLFENIYEFYLNLFLTPKSQYPLTNLLVFLSDTGFYNEYVENNSIDIESFKNSEQIQQISLSGQLVIQVAKFQNNFELYSLKQMMKFATIEDIRKLVEFIGLIEINKKLIKIPGNCEVNEIYSVSGIHLLESSSFIEQPIPTFGLDIDIIIRGGSLKQAENLFYEILMQKCRLIQKQNLMGVLGIYNSKDLEKLFKIHDPKNQASLEQFRQVMEFMDTVYLKVVLHVQQKIKLIDYKINFHFVKNDGQVYHYKKISQFDTVNRIFFSKPDISTWIKLYGVTSMAYDCQFSYFEDFDMNLPLKKYLIQSLKSLEDEQESKIHIEPAIQILYHQYEKLVYLAKEILNYYYLIQYIKKDRTGKFEIKDARLGFQLLITKIENIVNQYSYIFNEGLTVTILHFCNIIKDYIDSHLENNGQERQLIYLENILLRIHEILDYNSITIALEYRNILKKMKPKLQLFF